MRIAITGGAGFIGKRIARGARALGHEVLVLDDSADGARAQMYDGKLVVAIDLRDPHAIARVFADFKPSVVCHQPDRRVPPRAQALACGVDAAVQDGLALLEACARSAVDAVVIGSSDAAIYGDLAERAYGLRAVALRYANVYGPGQDPRRDGGAVAIFCERMLRHEPIRIHARTRRGDDGCVRDYVFVNDVVRANLAAIEGRVAHRVMNVCTGQPTSTRELAEQIRALCGSRSSICYASPRPGDAARALLDAARCRSLGRPTSLREGLAHTLRWFASRLAHGECLGLARHPGQPASAVEQRVLHGVD